MASTLGMTSGLQAAQEGMPPTFENRLFALKNAMEDRINVLKTLATAHRYNLEQIMFEMQSLEDAMLAIQAVETEKMPAVSKG